MLYYLQSMKKNTQIADIMIRYLAIMHGESIWYLIKLSFINFNTRMTKVVKMTTLHDRSIFVSPCLPWPVLMVIY